MDRLFFKAAGEEESACPGKLRVFGVELCGEGIVHSLGFVGGLRERGFDSVLRRSAPLEPVSETGIALGAPPGGARSYRRLCGTLVRKHSSLSQPSESRLDLRFFVARKERTPHLGDSALGLLEKF